MMRLSARIKTKRFKGWPGLRYSETPVRATPGFRSTSAPATPLVSNPLTAPRPGFTLIEMLLVLILLAVVGGIMALLLKETLAVERSQAEGFDKLLHDNALADQFRSDVAQALDAPTEWHEHHADERTLILQMPAAGYVVYRWNDGQLKRRAFEKQTVAERLLPVDGSDVEVKFVRPTANAKLIGLRLHVARKGSPLPGQTLEIVAALAGDWR